MSAEVFEKLRSGMRTNRLVYGERPIGVALRPHLLDEIQFHALTQNAQLIASAMEKMTAAALQSPALMRELGLSDAEISLALVDPGLSFAAITTRIDSFVTRIRSSLSIPNAKTLPAFRTRKVSTSSYLIFQL